jgi:hypothetical protein
MDCEASHDLLRESAKVKPSLAWGLVILLGIAIVWLALLKFSSHPSQPAQAVMAQPKPIHDEFPPPVRYEGDRQKEFAARWRKVVTEAGPPPRSDCYPVLAHATRTGIYVKAHWRSMPDNDLTNNLRSRQDDEAD